MNKEPIICFECKKLGHIKIDCPKLRKEKRSSKEKFKKAFVVWRGSDDDTSDDEASDEEDANLCLEAKKDDTNEVNFLI